MSVQISYKKQVIFGILLVVVGLVIIEASAYVWWLDIQNCEFKENEIFENVDQEVRQTLCEDHYSIRTSGYYLIPNQKTETISINSLGFRGPEFTADKPENTYRIFLVGGSTMFGSAASSDATTIPGYLQQLMNDETFDFNIQVINAGISGANSVTENKLIKEKLIGFDPDLIIMYDGVNDLRAEYPPQTIKDNWQSVCELGKREGFDVIVTLQPFAGMGNKVLTKQEYVNSLLGEDHNGNLIILKRPIYDRYSQELAGLSDVCNVEDLRNSFDGMSIPIYWDEFHTANAGNLIMAEKFYNLALPIIHEPSTELNYSNNGAKFGSDDVSSFQGPTIFEEIISYYKTPAMISYYFSQPEQKPDAFRSQEMDISLVGEDLSNVDLSEMNLSGKILSGTNLSGQDLSDKDLTGTVLRGADLSYTDLSFAKIGEIVQIQTINFLTDSKEFVISETIKGIRNNPVFKSDLSGANLTGANLRDALLFSTDLSNAILTDVDLDEKSLMGINLSNVDFSEKVLLGTNFFGANLSGANFSGAKLIGTTLLHANLSHANLSNVTFDSISVRIDITASDEKSRIVSRTFEDNLLYFKINVSYVDLENYSSDEIFYEVFLKKYYYLLLGTEFSIEQLDDAIIMTGEIKPDLRYADLTGTNLLNANIEVANLEGAILDCVNHPICS